MTSLHCLLRVFTQNPSMSFQPLLNMHSHHMELWCDWHSLTGVEQGQAGLEVGTEILQVILQDSTKSPILQLLEGKEETVEHFQLFCLH